MRYSYWRPQQEPLHGNVYDIPWNGFKIENGFFFLSPDPYFGISSFSTLSVFVDAVLSLVWSSRVTSSCSVLLKLENLREGSKVTSWAAICSVYSSLSDQRASSLTLQLWPPLPSFWRQWVHQEVSGHEDHCVSASSHTLGHQERTCPLWTDISRCSWRHAAFSTSRSHCSQWLIESHLPCHWWGRCSIFSGIYDRCWPKSPLDIRIWGLLREWGSWHILRELGYGWTLCWKPSILSIFICIDLTTQQPIKQTARLHGLSGSVSISEGLSGLNNLCIWGKHISEMNALSHLSLYSDMKLWLNIETIDSPLCWRHWQWVFQRSAP